MKEQPIIFNAESVRAILSGQKTQTRHVIRAQPRWQELTQQWLWWANKRTLLEWRGNIIPPEMLVASPYQIGMSLWVRETWRIASWHQPVGSEQHRFEKLCYRATSPNDARRWTSPILMPRWASRITLEITGVRGERVQDISEEDAKAEGVSIMAGSGHLKEYWYRAGFAGFWDEVNAKRGFGWDTNPWVWVIEFARVKC